MKSFWSYVSNGKYAVGCTGGTVYVYVENMNLMQICIFYKLFMVNSCCMRGAEAVSCKKTLR